jgi:methylthioribose-1-phosphate isomerase
VARLAAAHQIPFYIAAPTSTLDLSLADGSQIPIEERGSEEITHGFGRQTAPEGVKVYNPAFDVTPAALIAAVICEKGVIRPVNREQVALLRRFREAKDEAEKEAVKVPLLLSISCVAAGLGATG